MTFKLAKEFKDYLAGLGQQASLYINESNVLNIVCSESGQPFSFDLDVADIRMISVSGTNTRRQLGQLRFRS